MTDIGGPLSPSDVWARVVAVFTCVKVVRKLVLSLCADIVLVRLVV